MDFIDSDRVMSISPASQPSPPPPLRWETSNHLAHHRQRSQNSRYSCRELRLATRMRDSRRWQDGGRLCLGNLLQDYFHLEERRPIPFRVTLSSTGRLERRPGAFRTMGLTCLKVERLIAVVCNHSILAEFSRVSHFRPRIRVLRNAYHC